MRVTKYKDRPTMDLMSRLNYSKVYNVEHNVKVYGYGEVHKKSIPLFKDTFSAVWKELGEDDGENEDDDESSSSSDDGGDNDDDTRKGDRNDKGKQKANVDDKGKQKQTQRRRR